MVGNFEVVFLSKERKVQGFYMQFKSSYNQKRKTDEQ